MKKLFILLSLCIGFSLGSFAQASTLQSSECQNVNFSTFGTGTVPGLSPKDSFLPCSYIGQQVTDTIVFVNYSTVTYQGTSLPLTSLTIDSLYLPAGLCWSTNNASNTFTTGDSGKIYVNGIPTDAAGQYKLRIIVSVLLGAIPLNDINAEQYTGLAYRVRVQNANCGCPEIDNSSADSALVYIPYTTCDTLGIKSVPSSLSNVNVMPNPFNGTATVTFASEVNGAYTVSMTNLLGEVVATKEMNVTVGNNTTTIERNGLTPGVYILSISNGNTANTRKIVIE